MVATAAAQHAIRNGRPFHEVREAAVRIQHAFRRRSWRRMISQADAVSQPLLFGFVAKVVHARDQTVERSSAQHRASGTRAAASSASGRRIRCALVIGLVEWPWFERVVLAAIVANCVMLGFDGPGACPTRRREAANLALLVLFSVELFCKVVAMGLVGSPHAFLRDGWHVIDAFLVASGWLEIVTEASNYTALRCLRALRALRMVTHWPALQAQVDTLVHALPGLRDVMLLTVFLVTVLSLLGMGLFKGALRYRCFAHVDATWAGDAHWDVVDEFAGTCNPDAAPEDDEGCGAELSCRQWPANPYHGTVSFDTFPEAMMTSFQIMTLEGWSDVMYVLQRGVNGTLGTVYCVGFVVLGPFCVLNLFLAVLFDSYGRQLPKSRRQELRGEMRGAAAAHDAADAAASPPPSPPVYGGGTPAWRLGGGGGSAGGVPSPSAQHAAASPPPRAAAQRPPAAVRGADAAALRAEAASRIRYHRGAAAVGEPRVGVSLEANAAAGGGEAAVRPPASERAAAAATSSPVRGRLRERGSVSGGRTSSPDDRELLLFRRRRAAEAAAVLRCPAVARVGDARLGSVGVGARRAASSLARGAA